MKYRWITEMTFDSIAGATKKYKLVYDDGTPVPDVAGQIVYKDIWGGYRATSYFTQEQKVFTKLPDAKKWIENSAGVKRRTKKKEQHPFGL